MSYARFQLFVTFDLHLHIRGLLKYSPIWLFEIGQSQLCGIILGMGLLSLSVLQISTILFILPLELPDHAHFWGLLGENTPS